MEKILIIKENQDAFERFFSEHMKRDDIDLYPLYRKTPGRLERLRSFHCKYSKWIPGSGYWYEEWKRKLEHYHTVIIFDMSFTPYMARYIHEKNPKARLIVWFWNQVEKLQYPMLDYCEYWSFDKKNCEKFGWHYNHQFYFEDLGKPFSKKHKSVFFVGYDKDRYRTIQKIGEELKKEQIAFHCHLFADPAKKYEEQAPYLVHEMMGYDQVIRNIKECGCILDLCREGQEGLTLRALEALFFRKKLITNNKYIANYDFYSRENIFILEQDPMEKLGDFVNGRMQEIEKDILEKYTYKDWMKTFTETAKCGGKLRETEIN